MENETIDRLQNQLEEILHQNQFLADKIHKLETLPSERIPPPPSKPFRIKLALPATYKGPEDKSVDIDTGIFQVSEYLLVCPFEKLQEAPFAASLLSGQALTWYQQQRMHLKKTFASFSNLADHMRH
jgi:hypothetical protein